MKTRTVRLGSMGLVLLAAAGVTGAAPAQHSLTVNGKTVTTNVRMIGGRPYAPLADLARALNMVVVRKPGGFALTPAGGANQVQGARQGRIGQELFSGKFRLTVTGVEAAEVYTERYYQQQKTIRPQGPGETLIIVNLRLKNGVRRSLQPVLTERIPGNTALADDQGRSYPPLDFDARQEGTKISSYAAAALLPGAAADLALVFSVPRGTRPRALVFTHLTYEDTTSPERGTDVRISLGD